MSVFHENMLIGASGQVAAGGISRSLRFNSADSAYLSRTPASAGNRKTWTWAGWVKRSALGAAQEIFAGGAGGTDATQFEIGFASSDILFCWGASTEFLNTTQVFRDVSAWYHIVVSFDTTQATANNRLKLYVNGAEVTTFSTNNRASLTQNGDFGVNQAALHTIGRRASAASWYLNGYLADIYFIDGQALTPSSFTETDATTGQLVKKAYTGSFTGNSFYLTFEDNSAATAAALGKDSSGLGNNWTPNNLSVTAGAGNDSLVDVPTNGSQTDTGVGGEVRGNYAVLLDQYVTDKTRLTMANGNLDVTFNNSGSSSSALSSIGVSSGKWYSEFTCTQTGSNYAFVGIASPKNNNIDSLGYGDSYAYVSNTGNKANNGSFVSYGATWTANDVIGVALDLDAGTITFYKNGVSQGQAYSSISGTYIIGCTGFLNWKFSANFGQRPFAYTAPSGFKALCDTNLPAPVVAKPNTVFNVITYTGTGANATIPNVNTVPTSIDFTPDLVWIKGRSGATDHALYDSVRDVQKDLVSNSTAAETTQSTGLTAFGTNTFNIGTLAKLNTSSSTYVGWCWDAGSSTVTNTAGSITSSVRANASAGFSIVRWDSTTLPKTVGHGLGAEPHLIIDKCINNVGSWTVYHKSLGNSAYLRLNTTDAQTTGATIWNSTTPTSTVFHVNDAGWWGGSGFNHVAYCFAPVAGYSSFGSYTGNGSADGPFVYTGFRPRWILIKNTSATGFWILKDTARDPANTMAYHLAPNSSDADYYDLSLLALDSLSNGFKVRNNNSGHNTNGNVYVYAAFAESPFQYARAR